MPTFLLLFFSLTILASASEPVTFPATCSVAAKNSSESARANASFVCDGEGDQQEINAAIQSLPLVGGTVLLMEGTYDIRKVEGTLGGILIDRSHVTLAGSGAATQLVLAPHQNTNVIRIIGRGVGDITIRDLQIDANRAENAEGKGDPKISHDRFEYCGIKAFCGRPGQSGEEPTHDITIRNTTVRNAHKLGIMLEGPNMKVIDNTLGNAGSDVVEILTGPGEIRGNTVVITGQTHVAVGSDNADSILMSDNIVHVKEGGRLDIAFRSWKGSQRHVIADNIVTVDAGGFCSRAIDARGSRSVISGNCLHSAATDSLMRLTISGGDAIVSGNVFENMVIEINDNSGENRPIILGPNVFHNTTIDLQSGNLQQPE
ncbi:MAG TPA: hypothetical protein PKW76_04420 [bacterium]|nr:hypothetical protein [bacterium]HPG44903.1 hypothetical protein [bacterium]HPM98068.1 hypothetical protein [bacterium]